MKKIIQIFTICMTVLSLLLSACGASGSPDNPLIIPADVISADPWAHPSQSDIAANFRGIPTEPGDYIYPGSFVFKDANGRDVLFAVYKDGELYVGRYVNETNRTTLLGGALKGLDTAEMAEAKRVMERITGGNPDAIIVEADKILQLDQGMTVQQYLAKYGTPERVQFIQGEMKRVTKAYLDEGYALVDIKESGWNINLETGRLTATDVEFAHPYRKLGWID